MNIGFYGKFNMGVNSEFLRNYLKSLWGFNMGTLYCQRDLTPDGRVRAPGVYRFNMTSIRDISRTGQSIGMLVSDI